MATLRWSHNGVQVDTFAGPANDIVRDRRSIQIAVGTRYIQMSMEQWSSLVQFVRLVGTEPHAYYWIDRAYDSGLVRDGIMTCVQLRDEPTDRDI